MEREEVPKMSSQKIVAQCAPTLAGLKTGSLFSIEFSSREEAVKEIRELNQIFRKKGIRAIPVGMQKKRTLIYLYRPEHLRKDFCDPEAAEILRNKGYSLENISVCISQLVRHLAKDEGFPHEIGLFLGYPPEDVKGFMNSPKEGVQCVGYWKVYGDREKAEKLFQSFQKCTEIFQQRLEEGASLAQLAVGPC